MHPVLIDAPHYGVSLHAFSAVFMIALLLAGALIPGSIHSITGIDRRRAWIAFLVIALATLAGGRIHFILNAPSVFTGRWEAAFKPWFGGYHIGGGFLGGLGALILTARWMGVPFGRLADGLLPPTGFCVAVGRLGCFLEGCCIGAPCNKAWCLPYPAGTGVHLLQKDLGLIPPDAHESLALHPLQLYFSLAAALVSVAMYATARRRRYDGEVALVGFFLFWATTALLEGFRAPWAATPLYGPFRQLHWLAILLAAASFVAVVVAEIAYRVRSTGAAAAPTEGREPLV